MGMSGTIAQILVVTGLVAVSCLGCGRKEVSARTQSRLVGVTKWKYSPAGSLGVPKGIVVEQHGEDIRARFCALKPGPEFTIDAVLASGTYLPARKALIFPLGMPEATSVEDWLALGGPHLRVPFEPKASRLIGELSSAGANESFQFTRYP